jgi:SNF2-related domain/Helicase conserved C-terminal domain
MEASMAGRPNRLPGKAKNVQERKPVFQGWNSTDEEEVERRRWRGLADVTAVEPLEPDYPYFGTFRVRSAAGGTYDVEVRSLTVRENSCGCPDWRVNGLGTCKHIEGVIESLRRKGKAAFAAAASTGSPRIEVFASIDGSPSAQIRLPKPGEACKAPKRAAALLAPLCDADGSLSGNPLDSMPALRTELAKLPASSVRLSRQLEGRLEEQHRRRRQADDRETFLAEVKSGAATVDILRHPLLPYQVEGMLHLAFGERALLADEMGLGKTVQAIAACELLRRRRGVNRVLVVLPASLKAEWEDQISRFTDCPVTVVSGARPERLRLYAAQTFFILVNYEQVLIDHDDINRIVRPDVVILDEAQRIKNWQTKTAHSVKKLTSRYAFVLTGTPLENRIDEVYSIVQYLDPRILGPLFRFNRDFYVLDERGRPIDYKNLAGLRERLTSVMLRRRKDEVEDQLPGRVVETYFVAMAVEQRLRYRDYEAPASRLIAQAQRRPLLPQEFDRLQQLLACMRMVCDTPYILDPSCRISPKLDELETILGELLADPSRKVIVFSEWERMLDLIRELAVEMGVEFAWHTGSVPQDKRRVELRRFKSDPSCRLFLSTDSGSVGLNLQAASAVINVDLPWNPAKLEQRIARAWRKHQTRAVTVVNLVCEDSIEHRILHILSLKQGLADGVLDGRGDVSALKMPSGRAAMVERMTALLSPPPPTAAEAPEPARDLATAIVDLFGEAVLGIERHRHDGGEAIIVVMDDNAARFDNERTQAVEAAKQAGISSIEFVGGAAWEAIARLAAAGVVRLADGRDVLHRSPAMDADAGNPAVPIRKKQAALDWLTQAERKLRMATLLADSGFAIEALPPLGEAAAFAMRGLAVVVVPNLEPEAAGGIPETELCELEAVRAYLPPGSVAHLASIKANGATDIDASRTAAQTLVAAARAAAERSWAA